MTTTTDIIIDALYDLSKLYPRYQMPADTAALYAKNLADLPTPAVLQAIDLCGKTGTFFPSLAEIRKQVGEQAANPNEIAESAWSTVMSEIKRVGQYRTPQFESPLIAEAVESIGWRQLCTMDLGESQKSFIFTYRNLRNRAVTSIQRGDFTDVTGTEIGPGGRVAIEGKVA